METDSVSLAKCLGLLDGNHDVVTPIVPERVNWGLGSIRLEETGSSGPGRGNEKTCVENLHEMGTGSLEILDGICYLRKNKIDHLQRKLLSLCILNHPDVLALFHSLAKKAMTSHCLLNNI